MGTSFKARIITALIGVPIVVLALLAPTPIITVAVVAASLIGLYEYYRAVGLSEHRDICIMGYIAAIVISCGAEYTAGISLVLVYVFIVALAIIMMVGKRGVTLNHIGLLLFGLIYIPYFLSHIVYVRTMDLGRFYIWLIFIGAFLTDTCAYFIGCRFGKHKLCPTISPKKTIEGAIAGVIGGGFSFVVYGLVVNTFFAEFLDGNHFSLILLFVLGLIASVISQIGDLTASAIKRQYNVKDFGDMLPGHGGILDRCDSIIFVAPTIFLFLYNISILV